MWNFLVMLKLSKKTALKVGFGTSYYSICSLWLKSKAGWLWVDFLVKPGTSKRSWSPHKYNEGNSAVTVANLNISTQKHPKQQKRTSLKKGQNVIMGRSGKSGNERWQKLCRLSQNQRQCLWECFIWAFSMEPGLEERRNRFIDYA